MSVEIAKDKDGNPRRDSRNRLVYRVRWREGNRPRSRVIGTRKDAEAFDAELKRRRRLGGLVDLEAGAETLAAYVEGTWAHVHAKPLEPKTRALYALLYDNHIASYLGAIPLRELTPEVIGRWQSDRLDAGAPVETTRKALTLLGGILQRATEAGRIASNPQRLVRKAAPAATDEVRPLAPATIERICSVLRSRDREFVQILAYAGLRPQEARALRWKHAQDRTLIVHAPKTRRHHPQPRTVRLLAPLALDLREWRMASGRPDDTAFVIPAFNRNGTAPDFAQEWTESGYENWINRVWRPALQRVGIPYQRPYDLRHSYASLLFHEGRSVVYVARQLGHSTAVCMRTYGHVIEELEDAPRITAEDAIQVAREQACVRQVSAE